MDGSELAPSVTIADGFPVTARPALAHAVDSVQYWLRMWDDYFLSVFPDPVEMMLVPDGAESDHTPRRVDDRVQVNVVVPAPMLALPASGLGSALLALAVRTLIATEQFRREETIQVRQGLPRPEPERITAPIDPAMLVDEHHMLITRKMSGLWDSASATDASLTEGAWEMTDALESALRDVVPEVDGSGTDVLWTLDLRQRP